MLPLPDFVFPNSPAFLHPAQSVSPLCVCVYVSFFSPLLPLLRDLLCKHSRGGKEERKEHFKMRLTNPVFCSAFLGKLKSSSLSFFPRLTHLLLNFCDTGRLLADRAEFSLLCLTMLSPTTSEKKIQ